MKKKGKPHFPTISPFAPLFDISLPKEGGVETGEGEIADRAERKNPPPPIPEFFSLTETFAVPVCPPLTPPFSPSPLCTYSSSAGTSNLPPTLFFRKRRARGRTDDGGGRRAFCLRSTNLLRKDEKESFLGPGPRQKEKGGRGGGGYYSISWLGACSLCLQWTDPSQEGRKRKGASLSVSPSVNVRLPSLLLLPGPGAYHRRGGRGPFPEGFFFPDPVDKKNLDRSRERGAKGYQGKEAVFFGEMPCCSSLPSSLLYFPGHPYSCHFRPFPFVPSPTSPVHGCFGRREGGKQQVKERGRGGGEKVVLL